MQKAYFFSLSAQKSYHCTVMSAIKARENLEISGNDDDVDVDAPVEL